MEEQVISISEIIDAVKKRWKIIALTTVLATLVSGIFSFFVISPTYEASTKVFIGKEESSMESYNYNDITMYQKLLKTYSELIKTKDLINRAITNSKYELKVEEVLNDVSVTTVADTQMIQIAYRSTSPNIAKNMLENITNEFIATAQELVPNGNVRILESVELPKNPVAPNKKMNIAIAAVLGVMASVFVIFLMEALNTSIKEPKDIEEKLGIPVFGVVPKY